MRNDTSQKTGKTCKAVRAGCKVFKLILTKKGGTKPLEKTGKTCKAFRAGIRVF
jgi:hypothetical protein